MNLNCMFSNKLEHIFRKHLPWSQISKKIRVGRHTCIVIQRRHDRVSRADIGSGDRNRMAQLGDAVGLKSG